MVLSGSFCGDRFTVNNKRHLYVTLYTANEIWSDTERKNRFRTRDFGSDGNGRLRKFITENPSQYGMEIRYGTVNRNGLRRISVMDSRNRPLPSVPKHVNGINFSVP